MIDEPQRADEPAGALLLDTQRIDGSEIRFDDSSGQVGPRLGVQGSRNVRAASPDRQQARRMPPPGRLSQGVHTVVGIHSIKTLRAPATKGLEQTSANRGRLLDDSAQFGPAFRVQIVQRGVENLDLESETDACALEQLHKCWGDHYHSFLTFTIS
jgi:hypothetical protein